MSIKQQTTSRIFLVVDNKLFLHPTFHRLHDCPRLMTATHMRTLLSSREINLHFWLRFPLQLFRRHPLNRVAQRLGTSTILLVTSESTAQIFSQKYQRRWAPTKNKMLQTRGPVLFQCPIQRTRSIMTILHSTK